VVEFLLENGADIDAKNFDGNTALHLGKKILKKS
jgi:ankyrin repeat protein